MHELGIMTSVMECSVREAHAAGAVSVLEVTLDVGEMTEAIPDALQFAWEVLQEGEPMIARAKLNVNMISPKSRCLECSAEYEHDRFHMVCPECGSGFTKLLRGRELNIASLDVDVPDGDV